MAVQKKKRVHKVSKGLRRHKKCPLSAVQRVLEGKGLYASYEPVEAKTPWFGVAVLHGPPFDRRQAELNKVLYPHLYDTPKRSTR